MSDACSAPSLIGCPNRVPANPISRIEKENLRTNPESSVRSAMFIASVRPLTPSSVGAAYRDMPLLRSLALVSLDAVIINMALLTELVIIPRPLRNKILVALGDPPTVTLLFFKRVTLRQL